MGNHRKRATVLVAALLFGACSTFPEDVWPTLTGENPPANSGQRLTVGPSPAELQSSPTISPAAQPAAMMAALPAAMTASEPIPVPAQPRGSTGTFVGAKVEEHARELNALNTAISTGNTSFRQLRGVTEQNAQRYYAIVAAISARLQIGTTPGNPVLVSQWNAAQSELDRILTDIAALNTLANDVASQAAMSAYLLESVSAAYGLSGAVEEDHRRLATVEDEVNRTVVLIDRLLNEINDTIARQTAYVNNERRNLTTLSLAIKNGEIFGPSLGNRAYANAVAVSPVRRNAANAAIGFSSQNARQPLVVIRFDRPDVPYQQALYTAVSQTLERRPSSAFDVIAVAPNRGSPAEVAINANESKRNAEHVFRTLTEMGLPGERVTLSATTSTAVQSNEVHIFLR